MGEPCTVWGMTLDGPEPANLKEGNEMQFNGVAKKLMTAAALVALLGACASTDDMDDDNNVVVEDDSADVNGPGAVPVDGVVTEEMDMGPAAGSVEDFVETAGDRVFFAFDSAELSSSARRTLQAQAAWLKRYPSATVSVEGHADERGTREYNLALGDRRATAAKNYLVALGISPDRISTISYGKERPVAFGSNEAAWSQNRRAVSVVSGADS